MRPFPPISNRPAAVRSPRRPRAARPRPIRSGLRMSLRPSSRQLHERTYDARMTLALPRQAVYLLSRSAVLASVGLLFMCASADAQTIGYLYSAIGGGVAQFDVGSDTSLTPDGTVTG